MIHVIFISRKAKKNEWVSKKLEIEAYENKLYLNKRSIFVNLDKTNNKIYIDNIYDDYMNSYDTTFCGYIDEKDSEKFLEFLKENNLWRYAIRCVQTAITRLTFRFTKILQNALIEIGVDEFESYRKGSRLASRRRLCRQRRSRMQGKADGSLCLRCFSPCCRK